MASAPHPDRPGGIPGSALAGPFPVGAYAAKLRDELRKRARVQLFGEVWNLRAQPRRGSTSSCATATARVPCAMWRDDFDALGPAAAGALGRRRRRSSSAGGPDYYPGVAHVVAGVLLRTSPTCALAGEGDLLAQLERAAPARSTPRACSSRRRRCPARALPRTIGVVTGEGGKARDDVLAGLRRRGWAGRAGLGLRAGAGPPRRAARSRRALQDLAAVEEVEVVIVARGGGSLADLFAFCDETLCRTVALLRVPVIALGRPPHRPHADRRRRRRELLDADARRRGGGADRLRRGARGAGAATRRRLAAPRAPRGRSRARGCSRGSSRAPAEHVARQRRAPAPARCASCAPARAAARARPSARARSAARSCCRRKAARRGRRASGRARGPRSTRLALALAAHDPAARARARLRGRRGPRRRAS